MLRRLGHGPAALARRQRNGEAKRDASQRRVDAGFQHADPEDDPKQNVGCKAAHVHDVHRDQRGQRSRRQRQREKRQLAGVEKRDDGDRAEVIHHGKRQEEGLQLRRNAAAEKRQDAKRESDVRRGRNGPAFRLRRSEPDGRDIDQRGNRHAADGGVNRQRGAAPFRQSALGDLPLDLKRHQQEEDRHQTVVDPEEERLGNALSVNRDGQFGVQEGVIKRAKRVDVLGQKAKDRRKGENEARLGGRIEVANGGDHRRLLIYKQFSRILTGDADFQVGASGWRNLSASVRSAN